MVVIVLCCNLFRAEASARVRSNPALIAGVCIRKVEARADVLRTGGPGTVSQCLTSDLLVRTFTVRSPAAIRVYGFGRDSAAGIACDARLIAFAAVPIVVAVAAAAPGTSCSNCHRMKGKPSFLALRNSVVPSGRPTSALAALAIDSFTEPTDLTSTEYHAGECSRIQMRHSHSHS